MLDNSPEQKILIIKPSALGDVVQTVTVVQELKQAWPQCSLGWLVNSEFAPLIKPLSVIDKIHLFKRSQMRGFKGKLKAPFLLRKLVHELQAENYDLVIDFQGLARSALLSRWSSAKRRIGFAEAREGASRWYHEKIVVPNLPLHAIDRYRLLLSYLGISLQKNPETDFEISEIEIAGLQAKLKQAGLSEHEKPIVLCPGAQWESKCWPTDAWAQVSDKLYAKTQTPCIFVGSSKDVWLVKNIKKNAQSPLVDFTGQTTLRDLAALFACAKLVISNDSGPMHLARAQSAPLIALFGPTDPRRTGPWRLLESVIQADQQAERNPRLYRQIRDDRIMRKITPERVFEKARTLLAS